jgi:hypothetical protein
MKGDSPPRFLPIAESILGRSHSANGALYATLTRIRFGKWIVH